MLGETNLVTYHDYYHEDVLEKPSSFSEEAEGHSLHWTGERETAGERSAVSFNSKRAGVMWLVQREAYRDLSVVDGHRPATAPSARNPSRDGGGKRRRIPFSPLLHVDRYHSTYVGGDGLQHEH